MKAMFTILGLLFLGLAAVGVLLPVLPTTPFVLVSAACFLRGSSRFRAWFEATGVYRRYGKALAKDRAMTMTCKLSILIPVTVFLGVAFFAMHNTAVRVVLVIAAILKWYCFVFKIRTISPGGRTTDSTQKP